MFAFALAPVVFEAVCCDCTKLQLLMASQFEQATSIASLSTRSHCRQAPQQTYFTPCVGGAFGLLQICYVSSTNSKSTYLMLTPVVGLEVELEGIVVVLVVD